MMEFRERFSIWNLNIFNLLNKENAKKVMNLCSSVFVSRFALVRVSEKDNNKNKISFFEQKTIKIFSF